MCDDSRGDTKRRKEDKKKSRRNSNRYLLLEVLRRCSRTFFTALVADRSFLPATAAPDRSVIPRFVRGERKIENTLFTAIDLG